MAYTKKKSKPFQISQGLLDESPPPPGQFFPISICDTHTHSTPKPKVIIRIPSSQRMPLHTYTYLWGCVFYETHQHNIGLYYTSYIKLDYYPFMKDPLYPTLYPFLIHRMGSILFLILSFTCIL